MAESVLLSEILRGAHVRQTCSACPSQWEGETGDDLSLYVRYRFGHLSIGLGGDRGEAIDNSAGWTDEPAAFSRVIGEELDGSISWTGVLAAVESFEKAEPAGETTKGGEGS